MGQGSGFALSRGVGCRLSLDPVLLWLWCRLAAVAPIRPLAWEPPYAAGVALKAHKKNFFLKYWTFPIGLVGYGASTVTAVAQSLPWHTLIPGQGTSPCCECGQKRFV